MATRTLTDKSIVALKPKAARFMLPDPKLSGHYVRVTANGAKTFVAVARDPNGKQVWHTIGSTQLHKIEDACELARTAMKNIKGGQDRKGPKSFQTVAEEWLKRHVQARGVITSKDMTRTLYKHAMPVWAGRDFDSITRSDVTELLDQIEDSAGPSAADSILSILSSMMNWRVTRNDKYVSPIVKGMRRTSQKERARTRILSDDEIRAVWKQAEANGVFGALIRLLLLTGQRRSKVAAMKWEHIEGNTWHIPNGNKRLKGTGGDLMLPDMAMAVIKAQPRYESNPYVLASRYPGTHYSNYGHGKSQFDAKLPAMPQWGLHDLRRTARSLMSRAGVNRDHAERVLGHAQPGVQGTYDRHSYREEKAQALRLLAGLIQNILRNDSDKVVKLRS